MGSLQGSLGTSSCDIPSGTLAIVRPPSLPCYLAEQLTREATARAQGYKIHKGRPCCRLLHRSSGQGSQWGQVRTEQ